MYKIRLQRDFFETCDNGKSDKVFLLTSKFWSLGAVRPYLGAIYMYSIMKKKCIKSDFKDIYLKLASNEWSDKTFLLTSKCCPLGTVCPCLGAIYMYKIMKKKLYKIRLQRDCFELANLQQIGKVIRCSCWHKNLSPRGCQPLPRGYIHV